MKRTIDSFFLSHPDPMWVYDMDTLRFLAVNNSAIVKYGYTREEFLAMTIADIRPDEDQPALHAHVAAVTDGYDEAGVWRHRLKSGEVFYVDITGHTIDHDGRRAEMIAARDVTERVESANALARAKRICQVQSRARDRRSRTGDLGGHNAHDLGAKGVAKFNAADVTLRRPSKYRYG